MSKLDNIDDFEKDLFDDDDGAGDLESGRSSGGKKKSSSSSKRKSSSGDGDDDGTSDNENSNKSCQCRHPVAAFFHLFFKSLALATYMFATWFFDSFVIIFIAVILFVCFDFWTVKNVTGRLLVGLRWWNDVKEDGTSVWLFESAKNMDNIDPVDAKVFWMSLYIYPTIWVVFGLTSILKLNVQWLVVVAVALSLNFANVIGYTKCRKDAKKQVKGFIAEQVMKRAAQAMIN